MKLAFALFALVLASTPASAAPKGDVTTARVVSVQTDWASGQTRVNLEIGGQLVEARIGDGHLELVPGQKTEVSIYRDGQRNWVIGPAQLEVVAGR